MEGKGGKGGHGRSTFSSWSILGGYGSGGVLEMFQRHQNCYKLRERGRFKEQSLRNHSPSGVGAGSHREVGLGV